MTGASPAGHGPDEPGPIDRRARGAAVEAAALAYLQQAGLREIAANVNYRGGELDLVMLDDGMLDEGGRDGDGPGHGMRGRASVVFVEVRYRRHAGFGGGAASIDRGKRRKLVRAAQLFLASHRQFADAACRFDVIDADGDPHEPRIRWLRDAFSADDC